MGCIIALVIGSQVMAGMAWKTGIPEYIARVNATLTAVEALAISQSIYRFSVAYGMDPRLVAAVIRVESGFNVRAVGGSGEVGLMQLHPKYHVAQYDVDANIQEGVKYLSGLRDIYAQHFHGISYVELYNRGPFCKKPKRFPYARKVAQAYRELGGQLDEQKGFGYVKGVEKRRVVNRRIASTAP